ncbi:MAG: PadR family transcriptional regulator [Motilibacteraceae bacterium]
MGAGAGRQSQLLRGTLDMCLLALIGQRPSHAYEVTARLRAAGFEDVSYGTVYPLVTRLRGQGLVREQVEDSATGPPRKVFHLTTKGRSALDDWVSQWDATQRRVQAVLQGAGALTGLDARGKTS